MCADDVVCCGAEPLAFLDYVAVGQRRARRGRRAGRIGRRRLSRGRLRARRRRDGRASGADGRRRVRPGGLLPRRRRARRRHRRLRGPRRRRDPRPGGVRAARERLLARPRARRAVGPRSDRPYQVQLRRTLGDAGRDAAIAAEPERGAGDPRRRAADPDPDLRAGGPRRPGRLRAAGADVHGLAHITGGGLPGQRPAGAARRPRRPASTRVAGRCRRSCALFGALGGLDDEELRATFNGGLGMVVVLPRAAVPAATAAIEGFGIPSRSSARSWTRRRSMAGATLEATLEGLA